MEKIYEMTRLLSSFPCVYRFREKDRETISAFLSPLCDSIEFDSTGNIFLHFDADDASAPTLLIDAHFDTVGMLVSGFAGGGFLSVSPVGSPDPGAASASEVLVHGRNDVYGILTSTPPHLLSAEDAGKSLPINKLLIDTGIDDSRLRESVSIGDPVTFLSPVLHMTEDVIYGAGLDNRICAATAICALVDTDKHDRKMNTVILLSAAEEAGIHLGARRGVPKIRPDFAMIADVNFLSVAGADRKETLDRRGGFSVSYSVLTDHDLTCRFINAVRSLGIPVQTVAEATNIGTDGTHIPLLCGGIPSVNISIPLGGMHTPGETVSLSDAAAMCSAISASVRTCLFKI